MRHLAICAFLVALTVGAASLTAADDAGSGVPPCVEQGPGMAESPDALMGRLCHPFLVAHPAPVAAVPPPVPSSGALRTPARWDPQHPLHVGLAYYPIASKRAHEEGRCIVAVTVTADGRITEAALASSTGYPRLDQACLKAVKGQRMMPATEDGKPIESKIALPIVWKLPTEAP
jgi:protein TonB